MYTILINQAMTTYKVFLLINMRKEELGVVAKYLSRHIRKVTPNDVENETFNKMYSILQNVTEVAISKCADTAKIK